MKRAEQLCRTDAEKTCGNKQQAHWRRRSHMAFGEQKMKIQLIKIEAEDCFESPELRTRARESSKSPKTIHYRVLVDDVEAAFVSLDRWPEPEVSQMVVYEIFVPRDMRRKGIGSVVLAEVENVAILEGFHKMHLRPYSLDRETEQTKLNNWYLQKGYNWDPNVPCEMEKYIAKTPNH